MAYLQLQPPILPIPFPARDIPRGKLHWKHGQHQENPARPSHRPANGRMVHKQIAMMIGHGGPTTFIVILTSPLACIKKWKRRNDNDITIHDDKCSAHINKNNN